jgi:ABC-type amino acid transport substrate-binding protein
VTQVKADIVQLTSNVSQVIADATQNKADVYSMDDYLGYLYLTLGVKDDQGVPFEYPSVQPANP